MQMPCTEVQIVGGRYDGLILHLQFTPGESLLVREGILESISGHSPNEPWSHGDLLELKRIPHPSSHLFTQTARLVRATPDSK